MLQIHFISIEIKFYLNYICSRGAGLGLERRLKTYNFDSKMTNFDSKMTIIESKMTIFDLKNHISLKDDNFVPRNDHF